MIHSNKDYSGNFIFEFPDGSGLTKFIPYALDTIHEYIKAKQEMRELKDFKKKSGAA